MNRSRVSASRALNGSSRRSDGGLERERARDRRPAGACRRTAWTASRRATSRRPDEAEQLARAGAPGAPRGQPASSSGNADVLARPSARRAAAAPGTRGRPPDPGRRPCAPSIATEPRSAAMSPARTRSSVLLPQPLGPMSATTSRGRDVERDAVEGGGRARAAERQRDVVDADAGAGAGRDAAARGRVEPGSVRALRSSAPPSYVSAQRGRTAGGVARACGHAVADGLLPSGLYRRLRSGAAGAAPSDLPRRGRSSMAPLVGSSRVAGPYHRSGIAPCPEGSGGKSTTRRAIDEVAASRPWIAGRSRRRLGSPRGTTGVPTGEPLARWNTQRSNRRNRRRVERGAIHR